MAADRAWRGSRAMVRRLRGEDGFTLVEALAGFAILAMLTLVVQHGLVMARTGLARSSERVAAEWVAQSLLAAPLGPQSTRSGAGSGTEGGLRWTMRLEPLDLPVAPAAAKEGGRAPSWRPMRVTFQVEMVSGRILEVETVRLARVE